MTTTPRQPKAASFGSTSLHLSHAHLVVTITDDQGVTLEGRVAQTDAADLVGCVECGEGATHVQTPGPVRRSLDGWVDATEADDLRDTLEQVMVLVVTELDPAAGCDWADYGTNTTAARVLAAAEARWEAPR